MLFKLSQAGSLCYVVVLGLPIAVWGAFRSPPAIGHHLSLKSLLRNVDVGFGGSCSQFVERSRLKLADAFLGNSHFFAYFLER